MIVSRLFSACAFKWCMFALHDNWIKEGHTAFPYHCTLTNTGLTSYSFFCKQQTDLKPINNYLHTFFINPFSSWLSWQSNLIILFDVKCFISLKGRTASGLICYTTWASCSQRGLDASVSQTFKTWCATLCWSGIWQQAQAKCNVVWQ